MEVIMEQTIAAIATAPGEGGIGIVRISGSEALGILKDVFRYKSGKILSEVEERRMIYGNIVDENGIVDEAMVVYMKSPRTYTGEDVVEIQCHGSIISLRRILSLALERGAALAERGEFTKRAFLNGRIDLSQAEAVIDVIKAKSDAGYDSAVMQLQGGLSDTVKKIRLSLADLLSDIVAHIEYPEEDLEELTYKNIISELDLISADIKKLADSFDTGRTIREGLRVCIVGRPNVGKSSLMNSILKVERAIVTDIPGTTRDTIEESASIGGIPVIITDTAGIRETDDTIEKIGIEKSRLSILSADFIIMMIDGSSDLLEEDFDILYSIRDKKSVIVLNKTDLDQKITKEYFCGSEDIKKIFSDIKMPVVVELSTVTMDGLDALTDEVKKSVYNGETSASGDILITNVRHLSLLKESLNSISDAKGMLENEEALDFAECDIRSAWLSLGEITGEAVTDDVIQEVFSRFCLGK
ncbi:MAG: tRNA uridine-5-carboxymethylaminomethyl(34) synthesis GTPase MnmE [Firmicutes bacterium]|nr:tRNA uridine-5-carboxymethylaminomethyl(34) synthesis GTPase MnmE [Bacillota bacterium]